MYTRILAPIDGSITSSHAFDEALKIARANGAMLQPLYVVDPQPLAYDATATFYPDMRDALLEEGRRLTAQAAERMTQEGVKGTPRVSEVELTGDNVAQRIETCAEDFGADLVVMGTHGRRGWRRLVLGSVAERFMRLARVPVMLVPGREAEAHAERQAQTAEAAG
ncbi:universal stress protein [Caballeronia ptereochthonis]|jgi:nucleotide-binding universal stress UspA family protein|uniref:UspA domain-containing protein n=1 Tax=Caballeronia ptereochthonis TaxID=1777144 RepID=A0A158DGV3_9BURK|nr:universal stress protein [Caballeronia ptereochthonis]SAK93861.1 UspA domain-containing protein [Caballeronia ptereochthonis]